MRRLTAFFTGLLLGAVAGCTAFKQPTEQEKQTVHELTSNMRTWALGRGLIDLPANWSGGGDVKLYYGLGADHSSVEVRVLGEGVTQQRFDAALQERASRIAAVKNYEMDDVSMLVSARGKTRQSVMFNTTCVKHGARLSFMNSICWSMMPTSCSEQNPSKAIPPLLKGAS